VIVKHCYNLSKLLRHLTASQDVNPPLLTLSRADEKTSVPDSRNKSMQAREAKQESLFPKGRNFK